MEPETDKQSDVTRARWEA